MLKNIKFYLDNASVDWMGIVSLVIFFLFFVGLVLYVFVMKKDQVDMLKNIPLSQDDTNESNSEHYEN
ncbi:MAG TPA: CcoQ/FixQ family Cbb3-type cytochrome c oxidase assembly chaperone [Bacteroidia bacterium]